MKRLILTFLIAMPVLPAAAQTAVTSTVNMIRTGWNDDQFALVTVAPIENPAHCSTPDGYISQKQLPGYSTYYSAALTAFTLNATVVITVHNTECGPAGRPKLIGVNLIRNAAIDLNTTVTEIDGRTKSILDLAQALKQSADQANGGITNLFRFTARDASGRSLINLVDSIREKVGAP
jgi:hypothetical protein